MTTRPGKPEPTNNPRVLNWHNGCDYTVDDNAYCTGQYDDPVKELREEADRLRLLATFLEEEKIDD